MLIQHLHKHFFSYSIALLTILAVASSFYRFTFLKDYLVSYEGNCDPYTQNCFLYCEDDECTDPFYYSIIERHAAEIYARCGEDVTFCDAAYECQADAVLCSISYCDPDSDGEACELLTEEDHIRYLNENDT